MKRWGGAAALGRGVADEGASFCLPRHRRLGPITGHNRGESSDCSGAANTARVWRELKLDPLRWCGLDKPSLACASALIHLDTDGLAT